MRLFATAAPTTAHAAGIPNKHVARPVKAVKAHPARRAVVSQPHPTERHPFVTGLRNEALRLHFGLVETSGFEFAGVTPQTAARYFAETVLVFDAFEEAVRKNPQYATLVDTGLERAGCLRNDIERLRRDGVACDAWRDGPGASYAAVIARMAATDPSAFACHLYNFYFAHAMGGRIAGAAVTAVLGWQAQFFTFPDDIAAVLDDTRALLEALASAWPEEHRARSTRETPVAFIWALSLQELLTTSVEF